MLWGIFLFIVLVMLEHFFPDDDYHNDFDEDARYFLLDELIDREDKNDNSM